MTDHGSDSIARIRKLEEEVSGLRRALRTRGLIEQAKGILAERIGKDPEQAFKHLAELSQQRNVSVVDLAADIVAGSLPGKGKGNGEPGFRRHLLRAAGGAATAVSLPTLGEALLRDGLGEAGVGLIAFAAVADGSARLLTLSGGDRGDGDPFVRYQEVVTKVLTNHKRAVTAEVAVYPVRTANCPALLLLVWSEPRALGKPELQALDSLAEVVDSISMRLLAPSAAPWDSVQWLQTVLGAAYGQGKLLTPVRDDAGRIVDFVVDFATGELAELFGRPQSDLVGSRLLDLEPHLAELGVFHAYAEAFEKATSYERPASYETVLYRGRPRRILLRRRAVRVGGQLLVSQQHLDRAQRKNEQVTQMEIIGRLGFAEWDLATGETQWSPGFHQLFGRDPAAGPSALDRLAKLVHAEDAPAVKRLQQALTSGPGALDLEFRVPHVGGDVRTLRLVAESRATPHGDVHLVQAVASDVTEQRAAVEALRRTEAQLGEQRMRAAAEREMTRQMREVWYPATALDIQAPGLRVRGRHWVHDEDRRFQADFLDAAMASDGDMLLAIGDIVGSGLAAAATMTRLMYPARVMGHAGSPPAEILEALNIELHRGELAHMAGMVLARYLPQERTVIWSQAGHLAPVLLRRGTARQLPRPDGVLLGLRAEGSFGQAVLALEPGDLVIFFTDGVAYGSRRESPDPMPLLLREFEKSAGRGGAQGLLERAVELSESEACLMVVEAEV